VTEEKFPRQAWEDDEGMRYARLTLALSLLPNTLGPLGFHRPTTHGTLEHECLPAHLIADLLVLT